jgi:hypothetical protein
MAALTGALACAALALAACDSPDRTSSSTPEVIRSAQEAVDAALLEAGELPGDWQIVDTPTPPNPNLPLPTPLRDRIDNVWRVWQTCAYIRLSGGFIALNRLANAQSDVNSGPDGVAIVTAATLFSRDDAVQPAVDELTGAAEECMPRAPGLTWEPGEISVEGDPLIAQRIDATITLGVEGDTQAFDLIAFSQGRMVSVAFMRDADEDLVNEVAAVLRAQLADAFESLDSASASR